MMEVHLSHNTDIDNYYITLINPEANKGWHVWESLTNDFQLDWEAFEDHFDQIEAGEGGWRVTDEDLGGKCIYRGSNAQEAKQAAIRYMEYL